MTHLPLCLNDITVFPPPCLTSERASEIYNLAFRRIMEYVVNSRVQGDVLEFGTFNGYTARTLAELMNACGHQGQLRLYDSWEGFPAMEGNDATCPEVTQHKTWKQGDCVPVFPNADEWLRKVLSIILPERVQCIKGFYNQTFSGKLDLKASIVHIDCDLYESTCFVLRQLLDNGCLSEGSVIMFDDWNNNFASNKYGERKAARELFPHHVDGVWWDEGMMLNGDIVFSIGIEPWFSYGSSGMAFIVQKA